MSGLGLTVLGVEIERVRGKRLRIGAIVDIVIEIDRLRPSLVTVMRA